MGSEYKRAGIEAETMMGQLMSEDRTIERRRMTMDDDDGRVMDDDERRGRWDRVGCSGDC